MKLSFKKIIGYILVVISSISFFEAGMFYRMMLCNYEPMVYPIIPISTAMSIAVFTLVVGLILIQKK